MPGRRRCFCKPSTRSSDTSIEVPGTYTLTELILDAVRRHKHDLVEHVRTALPARSRAALDVLFEKAPSVIEDLEVRRANLEDTYMALVQEYEQ